MFVSPLNVYYYFGRDPEILQILFKLTSLGDWNVLCDPFEFFNHAFLTRIKKVEYTLLISDLQRHHWRRLPCSFAYPFEVKYSNWVFSLLTLNSRLQISGKSKIWWLKAETKCASTIKSRDLSRKPWTRLRSERTDINVLLSRFWAFILKLLVQIASPVSAGRYDPRAIRALQLRQKLIINLRYARNK